MNNNLYPVILVGNGLNRIGGEYSWQDLITRLRKRVGGGQEASHDKKKPFPLLYEELITQGYHKQNLSEENIKEFICQETKKIEPNPIHHRIIQMNFKHFLTTNYDHALEKAAANFYQQAPKLGCYNEERYSLFRKNCFKTNTPKVIWHLHGDQEKPDSVTLGYDQYSGYLQAMYSYVRIGYKWGRETWPALVKQVRDFPFTDKAPLNRSWIDFFFVRDVYILGLALDFVEFHLWWLLTFRPRAEIRSDVKANRVVYLYREGDQAPSDDVKAKLSLFQGIKVDAIALKADTGWMEYYNRALDWIDEDIRTH